MNLLKNLGAEAFEQRIGKARNGFMFSLEILERQYDMHTPEGKTEFYYEAAKRLAQFEEEIERNNYIDAVAEAYHIGYDSLRKFSGESGGAVGMASPVARPRTHIAKRQNKKKRMDDASVAKDSAYVDDRR